MGCVVAVVSISCDESTTSQGIVYVGTPPRIAQKKKRQAILSAVLYALIYMYVCVVSTHSAFYGPHFPLLWPWRSLTFVLCAPLCICWCVILCSANATSCQHQVSFATAVHAATFFLRYSTIATHTGQPNHTHNEEAKKSITTGPVPCFYQRKRSVA